MTAPRMIQGGVPSQDNLFGFLCFMSMNECLSKKYARNESRHLFDPIISYLLPPPPTGEGRGGGDEQAQFHLPLDPLPYRGGKQRIENLCFFYSSDKRTGYLLSTLRAKLYT